MTVMPSQSSNSARSVMLATAIALAAFIAWHVSATGLLEAVVGDVGPLTAGLFNKAGHALILFTIIGAFGLFAASGFRRPVRPLTVLIGLPMIVFPALALLQAASTGMTADPLYLLGWVVFALFVALGEEGLFRGLLYKATERWGVAVCALITSAGFGALHLLGLLSDLPDGVILAQAVFAASVGLVLFAVRLAAGSIWTAIALHFLMDALALLAAGGITTLLPEPQQILVGAAIMAAWGGPAIVLVAWWKKRKTRAGSAPEGATA